MHQIYDIARLYLCKKMYSFIDGYVKEKCKIRSDYFLLYVLRVEIARIQCPDLE